MDSILTVYEFREYVQIIDLPLKLSVSSVHPHRRLMLVSIAHTFRGLTCLNCKSRAFFSKLKNYLLGFLFSWGKRLKFM